MFNFDSMAEKYLEECRKIAADNVSRGFPAAIVPESKDEIAAAFARIYSDILSATVSVHKIDSGSSATLKVSCGDPKFWSDHYVCWRKSDAKFNRRETGGVVYFHASKAVKPWQSRCFADTAKHLFEWAVSHLYPICKAEFDRIDPLQMQKAKESRLAGMKAQRMAKAKFELQQSTKVLLHDGLDLEDVKSILEEVIVELVHSS